MRLVSTREAISITGISSDQLREWTTRRALIPADIQQRGRGCPAQYSWKTLLLIKIAAVLRESFRVELEGYREAISALRETLLKSSFIALRGHSVVFNGPADVAIFELGSYLPSQATLLVIKLDPILDTLATGLRIPKHAQGQLELFPARSVPSGSGAISSTLKSISPNRGRRRA